MAKRNTVQFSMEVKARTYDWLASNIGCLEDDAHPSRWDADKEVLVYLADDEMDDWQYVRAVSARTLIDTLSKLKF